MTLTFNTNNPMKQLILLCATILFLLFLTALSGCNNDPEIAETERVKSILIDGTWNVQSVIVSGTDQTSVYNGLQINFTGSGYTAQNGGSVWPPTGTWEFTDETAKSMIRNDDLVVSIAQLEQKKLVLELTWNKTTLGSGRVGSISGAHTFTLIRP